MTELGKLEVSKEKIDKCINKNGNEQISVRELPCCGLSVKIQIKYCEVERKASECKSFNECITILNEKDQCIAHYSCNYEKINSTKTL